ncbi:MAG: hypothetical protein H6706_20675 [Myxococcales bacterium]|nr:hypothetical protein [Myxococcales bacterium]
MSKRMLLLALGFLGCSETATGPAEPATEGATAVAVAEGKADDYFSTNGKEYDLRGTDRFELARLSDESDEDFLVRAAAFAELRFTALTYFINAYVTGKSTHDGNYGYGGFRTTIRQRSIRAEDVVMTDEGKFSALFETEFAGPTDLASQLGAEKVDEGLWRFDVIVPQLTEAEVRDGSFARKYRDFKGNELPEEQRTLLSIDFEVGQNSIDAYPRYFEMMDDGVLDIAIQVGGDYNEKRWDRIVAQELYTKLTGTMKFKSPVAKYEDLTLDSGPFTRELETLYGPIEVKVYLVHPDMAVDNPQRLVEAFKAHAATRDIVIYDGHAGFDASYSGVVVTYQPRTAIPADAFKSLDLPEKPQLFFFNGCKTYSVYPDALLANPKKTPENLDIISTVNFSWLAQMTTITSDFIGSVIAEGRFDGLHEPATFARILSTLNKGRSWDVIYGVHGADDNPHKSPWADEVELCQACRSHADCPGADALCVSGACGYGCTADDGCPSDYSCRAVAVQGVITGSQCLPRSRSCR